LFTDLKKLKKSPALILGNLMTQSYLRLRLWLINILNQALLNIDFSAESALGSADFLCFLFAAKPPKSVNLHLTLCDFTAAFQAFFGGKQARLKARQIYFSVT
jgi:hypothetical protein